MRDVRDALRNYILAQHLPGESPESLLDDTPLVTSSLLDSLGVVSLISYIEKTYGVRLDARDTTVERFDRIEDIAATIARKQSP